ncbi:hypothetical protein PhaeoP83_01732 [Phaeobacter inhibens]|uniref:hypothetical protein n=1 Tax=Phaeobacter inhibens TaxID=221822 RepID=UPI000C9B7BDA|nr:hypothetical protein [Phaeobacter inhibens]AUQ50005.1 hypothetical protein PhaeoP83_01732 [Phaeobacter inhibens]AUQ54267.1 hypothetical protein PhaeoP92_01586 [Phaeobacter inhibens]AUQ78283.1 hypothetical protein PhaeoP74_01587 [Phaeobacter inhibens]AUR15442.1 hypothetical protein PhaeoP70_01585 [Phaeobacter inhibens]AUR19810.1 hypothetical protein PhaeoP80_01732 [Phaeobacter inhibens]
MNLPAPPQFKSNRSTPKAPQAETPEQSGTPSNNSDDGAILDGFVMPDIEAGDSDDPAAPIEVGEDGERLPVEVEPEKKPEKISQEAFWFVFQTTFDWPAMLLAQIEPMAAKVAIQPEEMAIARKSSDNIYALLAIYYPKALVPGSDTIAHVLHAAPFIVAKVMLVREIFRQRKARDITPPEPAQPPAQGEAQQPEPQEIKEPHPTEFSGSWNLPDQPGAVQ